jgi:hypothetical protein
MTRKNPKRMAPLLGRQATIGSSGGSFDCSTEVLPENLGGADKLRIGARKQSDAQQQLTLARDELTAAPTVAQWSRTG